MCTAHTSYRLSYSLAQTLGVITLRGPNELLHVEEHHDHDGVVEQVVIRGEPSSKVETPRPHINLEHSWLGSNSRIVLTSTELTTFFNVRTACSSSTKKTWFRCISNSKVVETERLLSQLTNLKKS